MSNIKNNKFDNYNVTKDKNLVINKNVKNKISKLFKIEKSKQYFDINERRIRKRRPESAREL